MTKKQFSKHRVFSKSKELYGCLHLSELLSEINKFKKENDFHEDSVFIESKGEEWYGDIRCYIIISGSRKLTDKELDKKYNEWLETQKQINKKQEDNERKLYESLKKKYEPE